MRENLLGCTNRPLASTNSKAENVIKNYENLVKMKITTNDVKPLTLDSKIF